MWDGGRCSQGDASEHVPMINFSGFEEGGRELVGRRIGNNSTSTSTSTVFDMSEARGPRGARNVSKAVVHTLSDRMTWERE